MTTRRSEPTTRFSADGGRGGKKERVIRKLSVFFERFSGLTSEGK